MPDVIGAEQWQREIEDDPTVRDLGPEPPRVKRKVPILLDESLASVEMVAALNRMKILKVRRLPAGTPDDLMWNRAKRDRAVIVSADENDFWDDHKYLLQDCPGVIVLRGKSTREHLQALRFALEKSLIVEHRQRYDTSRDVKIKASPSGAVQQKMFIQGRTVVEDL